MSGDALATRITLNPDEAAYALGVGRTFFFEHVYPHLPVIRLGKKRLIPVRALQAWADEHADYLAKFQGTI